MQRKIKQFLAISMAFSMLFTTNAFATEINLRDSVLDVQYDTLNQEEGTNYYNDEISNNWSKGIISEEVRVNIDLASHFTITIPKDIILDGETGEANYIVNAKGDIAGDQVLEVIPDDEFYMADNTNKDDILATVTQENNYYLYSDIIGDGTDYTGKISAPITAGIWAGRFNFNIRFIDNLMIAINPTITYTTTSSSTAVTQTFTSYDELKEFTAGNTELKEVTLKNREFRLPNSTKTQTLSLLSENDEVASIPASFSGYFNGCSNLTKLNLENFVMTEVIDVAEMIRFCDSLTDENITGLKIPNAINKNCIREHKLEGEESDGLINYKCKYCGFEKYARQFYYSGEIEEITLGPGTYKLETWGAQGGNGGKGGYSYGNLTLSETTTLYVCVAGAGESTSKNGVVAKGGYNGGNSATGYHNGEFYNVCYKYYSTGGGATHIALSPGLLSTLYEQKDNVIIVSGGGGGKYTYYRRTNSYTNNGESTSKCGVGGGGNNPGGNGSKYTYYNETSGDRSYTTNIAGGGLSPTASTFGKASGMGGGGYEGGRGDGAGGSGYISSILSESGGTSGIRSGNGYAEITKIS